MSETMLKSVDRPEMFCNISNWMIMNWKSANILQQQQSRTKGRQQAKAHKFRCLFGWFRWRVHSVHLRFSISTDRNSIQLDYNALHTTPNKQQGICLGKVYITFMCVKHERKFHNIFLVRSSIRKTNGFQLRFFFSTLSCFPFVLVWNISVIGIDLINNSVVHPKSRPVQPTRVKERKRRATEASVWPVNSICQ